MCVCVCMCECESVKTVYAHSQEAIHLVQKEDMEIPRVDKSQEVYCYTTTVAAITAYAKITTTINT